MELRKTRVSTPGQSGARMRGCRTELDRRAVACASDGLMP